MIKIGIFGKEYHADFEKQVDTLFKLLNHAEYEIFFYKPFYEYVKSQKELKLPNLHVFENAKELKQYNPKLLISIGGDGTLLQAASFVLGSKIPILGVNTGRLGFLSSISFEEIEKLVPKINEKDTYIERRSLLEINSTEPVFGEENFALNELTISRRDTSSMIMITVYINDDLLNTYWCDGLIISTPTGSTAYSLSCGGPIVVPNSNVFVITPIAPHNLNIRPMIISDKSVLKIKVSARNDTFLVSLDSRTYITPKEIEFTVQKHPRKVGLIRLLEHNYLNTLRNKLNWGLDKRN
jgi:NAD+ kinase